MRSETSIQAPPALHRLGCVFYRIAGWKIEGTFPPDIHKAVVLLAPHTSSWDFYYWLFGSFYLNIIGTWLAKEATFRTPIMGQFLRAIGGVPVDRSKRQGYVFEAVKEFERRDAMLLILAPAGTREKTDHWKSGFYHIAREANVPLLLGYADYAKRTAGISKPMELTGDIAADLAQIEAFYAGVTPCRPEKRSAVRLLDHRRTASP